MLGNWGANGKTLHEPLFDPGSYRSVEARVTVGTRSRSKRLNLLIVLSTVLFGSLQVTKLGRGESRPPGSGVAGGIKPNLEQPERLHVALTNQ